MGSFAAFCSGVFLLYWPYLWCWYRKEDPALYGIRWSADRRAVAETLAVTAAVLAVLTAVTVVLGMRMMGALLISSLIIFPPLAAMRVFRTFKSVTVCSAVLSVACFIIGMTASYALETPSGASVVCADILAFALFALIGRIKR